MSTILDALRRAEAERQRGQVPGLHSLGAAPPAAPSAPERLRRGLPGALALLGGVALLAVLGWTLRPGAEAPAVPDPAAAASPAARPMAAAEAADPVGGADPGPAAAPPGSAGPAQAARGADTARTDPAVARAEAPHPAPPLPPAAPADPDRPGGSSLRALPSADLQPPAAPVPAPPAAQAPAATAAAPVAPGVRGAPAVLAPPTPPAAPEAAPRPRARAELPADLQAALSGLSFGGAVHSADPAARLLLVNGQVLKEGATLAEGLRLLEIGPASAVLDWRGQRHAVRY